MLRPVLYISSETLIFSLCHFHSFTYIIATETSPHFKSCIRPYIYRKAVGACLWVS